MKLKPVNYSSELSEWFALCNAVRNGLKRKAAVIFLIIVEIDTCGTGSKVCRLN
jgi:hypothetical protein